MYTNSFLRDLRKKAMKKKIWYKITDGLERNIYNLTCQLIQRVKSPLLGRILLSIILKIRDALKGSFTRLVNSLGVQKAWQASLRAVTWGNKKARNWKDDSNFSRYNALILLNNPSWYGI